MAIQRKASFLVAFGAATSLVLAGCSAEDVIPVDSNGANASQEESADEATTNSVAFVDGYIREKPADSMMTAVFGTIVNNTNDHLTVEGFEVRGLAEGTGFEVHEVADGVMRPVDGGLEVPADSEVPLAPGGEHLMIMDNPDALEPGQEFTLVLRFSDGSELTVSVPVRVQPSGEESYGDLEDHADDHTDDGGTDDAGEENDES